MKAVVVVIGIALMSFSLYGQSIGDYRTSVGWGNFADASTWQTYTASGWQNASVAPPTPFDKTIEINHYIYDNMSFVLSGTMLMGINGRLEVQNNHVFEVTQTGSLSLRWISVNGGGYLLNRGTITSAGAGATIVLDQNSGIGSVLENHGSIDLEDDASNSTYNLTVNTYSKVISGANGTITGTGSCSTNGGGMYWEIANSGGFSEAVQLEGPNDYAKAFFLFNGNSPQVTSSTMPNPIYGVTFANPAGTTLSKNISVDPWTSSITRVQSGASLIMGTYIIASMDWGNASFVLEEGASITTAHPEGISSEVLNQKIYLGCIQTNTTSYSSSANYAYNGTSSQVTGNFVTAPAEYTVNNLTITNTSGVTASTPLIITGTLVGAQYLSGEYEYTLPVTLSSFTAQVHAQNYVRIMWVTQSETNCLGYYLYRSLTPNLINAYVISPLISANNTSQQSNYTYSDNEIYDSGQYYYWLQDMDFNSIGQFHGPIMVQVNLAGGETGTVEVPVKNGIAKVYPNPFNPELTIRYGLASDSDVRIQIFNVRGQIVESRSILGQTKGYHPMIWDTSVNKIPSGAYIIRFDAGDTTEFKKVILSK